VKGPRVLALTGQESGCVLWRVWQPYTELQRQGYGAWFRDKDDPEMHSPEWAYLAATRLEAVVLPRFSWDARNQAVARRWVRAMHNAGLAVIYEVDDDVFTPQIGARQHATTEAHKTLEQLEQDRRGRIAAIRLCDGLTVSTEQLAAVVTQYVAPDIPVMVVPNAIDVAWFSRTIRGAQRQTPRLSVGWAGGSRYAEDLAPIAEAWSAIAQRFSHVHFVVQGHASEVLELAVPRDRLHVTPWLSVTEYPRALRNIDIGCASVAPNHFNRCKTPIKVWEYTLAGAVTVSSPTLYEQAVTDEQDGLIAETATEWETALARLIEDGELRKRLRRAQRRRIAEHHTLARHAHEWPKAWRQIIDIFHSKRRLALAG
jgi:glycosyltransferase involved in cell wall biosynthesis